MPKQYDFSDFDTPATPTASTAAPEYDFSDFEEPSAIQSLLARIPGAQTVVDALPTVGQKALDFAQGAGQGLTLGTADEIGGAIGAGAEALYNKFDPTNADLAAKGFNVEQPGLQDLYRQNQQQIQGQFDAAQTNSPVINTVGNIGGAIVGAPAMLGAATAAGANALGLGAAASPLAAIAGDSSKLARLSQLGLTAGKNALAAVPGLALEGATNSKTGGVLTEDERSKLASDVADNVKTGAALVGAGTVAGAGISAAAGKVKDALKDSPLAQQLGIAFDYGTQGINPRDAKFRLATELGVTNNAQIDNKRTKELVDQIYEANTKIGTQVKSSIDKATQAGVQIDVTPEARQALDQLQNLISKYPELSDNTNVRRAYQKIAETGQVDPREAKDLLNYMDRYIGLFKSSSDPLQKDVRRGLIEARTGFDTVLKDAVPEYAQAAERYSSFNRLVPETIIAGSSTPEVEGKFFSTMNNGRKSLTNAIKKLNQGATAGNSELDSAFGNSIIGMKQFEADDAARLARGEINETAFKVPVSSIEENIKRNSNDAIVRNSKDALEGGGNGKAGALKAVKSFVFGGGGPLKNASIATANKTGKAVNAISDSSVGKIGRSFAKAPDTVVRSAADVLQGIPGLQRYGNSLKEALDSGNAARKNQILFTVMQNPAARSALGEDHTDGEEE
jgi:hypothetical protein